MFERKLNIDYAEARRKAYAKLDPEHAEALWEDIEMRLDAGLPVGQKAKEQVMKRRKIKASIPKN